MEKPRLMTRHITEVRGFGKVGISSGKLLRLSFCAFPWLALVAVSVHGADAWKVSSPDGKITVNIQQQADKSLTCSVRLGDRPVVEDSPLGLFMQFVTNSGRGLWVNNEIGDFSKGLTFVKEDKSTINETYPLPSGKKSTYVNHCNELALTFRNPDEMLMVLSVRAYDDGMAYRYAFPTTEKTPAGTYTRITKEYSAFKIPMGSKGWNQPWASNTESLYRKGEVGKDFMDDVGFPALFQTPKNDWVLLTEAAVYGNYCACRLEGEPGGVFKVCLYKETDGRGKAWELPVSNNLPFETPWRVVIVGKTLAPIIETNIVENLNPPSEVSDMRWIKPGRTSWTWWYDEFSKANKSRMAVIYPVDRQAWDEFAANEMGWEYGCGRHQFGYDWTGKYRGFSDRERLLTLGPNLEAALDADLAAREASGMTINKCDFMDGDSRDRMRDYDAIAKMSAKHKIMLNWHGAALPRGQRRRWPNLVGYEGVLGAEYYIWSQGPTLIHRLCLPFTRNVVGPMDFTGVDFSTIDAKRQNTDAAELSEAVLYENGFSYWGDAPEIYRSIPAAMSFLKKCPAAWDETRFVDGYPGEYVVLARRKGDTWFIGGMQNGPARTVTVPLGFLDRRAAYQLELHHDGADKHEIKTETQSVMANSELKIRLLENGGFCGVISPRDKS
jgi:hypothetical protein